MIIRESIVVLRVFFFTRCTQEEEETLHKNNVYIVTQLTRLKGLLSSGILWEHLGPEVVGLDRSGFSASTFIE
jgi:hypothetical protein